MVSKSKAPKPNKEEKKEIDQHSGVETTGHEWDGIKELNNPAPRWWLWVFYITCVWALCYWVIFPAWPTLSGEGERGGTQGRIGWTQYKQLKEQQSEIIQRKSKYLSRFHESSFDEILNDQELYAFAIAGGNAAFKDNCATCHGTGGAGAKGYPNLNDDDWLWGGTLDAIYTTIKYGVRSHHDDTKISDMPVFSEILSAEEIKDVSSYVLSLSKGGKYPARGKAVFKEQCASCHGASGKGDHEYGAPNLADALWFYSDGDLPSIIAQVSNPKHGVMPTWLGRLDEDTIRQLSIYVHSLGGGK